MQDGVSCLISLCLFASKINWIVKICKVDKKLKGKKKEKKLGGKLFIRLSLENDEVAHGRRCVKPSVVQERFI